MSPAAAPTDASIEKALALADRHMGAERWNDAAAVCRKVLERRPGCAPALHLLGVIASRTGDLPGAIDLVRRAIVADGGAATYLCNLCEMCRLAGRLDEALDAGRRAVAIAPGLPQASNNLGIVLFELGEFAQAEACYRDALEANPNFAQAHSNLGNALRAQHRLDEALGAYRRAVAIDPNFADAWSNLGSVLNALGRADEAMEAYRTSVATDPLNANGHTGVALQLLRRGRFDEGWCEYEWRWRSSELAGRELPGRRWLGDDIAGQRILLWAEQGLGDTLQFCRYASLVAARGADVVLQAPRSLVRLLSASVEGATVVGDDEAPPPYDLQCPLLSLPLLFATDANTIPADAPYLHAPPADTAKWRGRIARTGRIAVGIAWAGSPRHMNDHNRSVAPAKLAPLFSVEGVQWIGLQVGPLSPHLRWDEAAAMLDAAPFIDDFQDTAGAVTALDLVICVDSALAHLAGALGAPTWVMLPIGSDWRWLLGRSDSPWYPSVRLFRQRAYGDWAPVMADVADALRAFAASRP